MTSEAQARLLAGTVVIFGLSGTGAVAAKTLTEAGIGELILVDDSLKELSELSRTLLADHASDDTKITMVAKQSAQNQTEVLLGQCHVALDALPNWQEKLVLSDLAMNIGKPLIHTGIAGFRYQLYSMLPTKSACLRCALPVAGIDDVPLQPLNLGKIKAVMEMAGAWQAIEAIKLIAHVGATQGNELFKFDCLSGEFEIVRGLDPRPDCPDCGRKGRRVI